MDGLVTDALVGLLGLQGLGNALGFVLQLTAIGGAVWLTFSYFRNRATLPATGGANISGEHHQPAR